MHHPHKNEQINYECVFQFFFFKFLLYLETVTTARTAQPEMQNINQVRNDLY